MFSFTLIMFGGGGELVGDNVIILSKFCLLEYIVACFTLYINSIQSSHKCSLSMIS